MEPFLTKKGTERGWNCSQQRTQRIEQNRKEPFSSKNTKNETEWNVIGRIETRMKEEQTI